MPTGTRTCVVCRAELVREDALRLVLGPDGVPAVDWRRKLPGRGASVCWTRSCLEGVRVRGRLDRSFNRSVPLPEGEWPLADARRHVEGRQRELLGLAGRAGSLKAGGNLVERLVRKGWPVYLLQSSDAGATVAAGWERTARSHDLELLRSDLSSEAIGAALGKSGPRSILAIGRGPLGTALRTELKRGLSLL